MEQEAIAWVREGEQYNSVSGLAVEWNRGAVLIEWEDLIGNPRRTWVQASTVTWVATIKAG